MKRLIFALCPALLLALSACAPLGMLAGLGTPPPAPVTLADRTTLDEQGLLGLELAYKGGRMAAEAGVDLGLIRGEVALKLAALDDKAFRALGAARAAYRAGNAASYTTALGEGQAAITGILALAAK